MIHAPSYLLSRANWLGPIAGMMLLASASVAEAQIAGDRTVGTQVNGSLTAPCTGVCTITGGVERGNNLFHSFKEFSIPTDGQAWFNTGSQIHNILTRVTGSSLSTIDGLIKVNSGANLFFLNPNGIVFGPNARLQISGSFFASTANSFKFTDDSEFSALNPQAPPLLKVNVPLGLQPGLSVTKGTISNQGKLTAGQDLTLDADTLELQGQLIAGRDLTLQAQQTVQIHRSATAPLMVHSGRDLIIQGNQGVDILALPPTPQSPPDQGGESKGAVQSGRNLSLISDGVISGDAHFSSGGTFQIRSLSGRPATFTSLYDPIISSTGDVSLAADYTGAALLIESQGSVRISGAVTITAPDTRSTFVGSDTVLSTQPGLIIRSGQPILLYGGTNQNNPPAFTSGTLPAGITLDSPVRVQPGADGGIVRLTADNGGITFHSIDASSRTGGNGGSIDLTANGSISNTGSFRSPFGSATLGSFSYSDIGDSRNGGTIELLSTSGDITLSNGGTYSSSQALVIEALGAAMAGPGGNISLVATNGNISLYNSELNSSSQPVLLIGDSGAAMAGPGGNIFLSATNGSISLYNSNLNSFSQPFVFDGLAAAMAGSGGDISLSATNGNISLYDSSLDSSSISAGENGSAAIAGSGGDISLSATNGNISLVGNGYYVQLDSSSVSFSDLGTAGRAGNIALTTTNGNISLSVSTLQAESLGPESGDGGSISLTTTFGDISLAKTDTSSTSVSHPGTAGSGGLISLTTDSGNIFLDHSESDSYSHSYSGITGSGGAISVSAKGGAIAGDNSRLNSFSVSGTGPSGDGGTVTLNARSGLSGLSINTVASGGKSGDVQINGFSDLQVEQTNILTAQQVEVKPCPSCPRIRVNLNDRGQAGNVSVTSAGNLTLDTTLIESDTRSGKPAGNVTITTPGRVTFNNSQIISNTSSSGQAGSILVNAPQVQFNDAASGLFAQTSSNGIAGNIMLQPFSSDALAIQFQTGAQISASTLGSGQGGSILVTAPESVTLAGSGKLTVETSSTGDGGNLSLTTRHLVLTDRVEASASTSAHGKAGSIDITAQTVSLNNGASVFTNTSGDGAAGNLIMNVQDQLRLVGGGTGLFASTTLGSTGNGGSIIIDPRLLQIEAGATIAVNSQGSGTGGNINLRAGWLELRDQGSITADTASAQGGNITLDVKDLVFLRRSSLISATAGTAQAGGDGGNIPIRAPFIIGVLSENSDITANAFTGRGGQINITTDAIYGLRFQPRLTPLSDITASSEFGISGTVAINTPNIDPNRGLVALPVNLVDPSQRIVQQCSPQQSGSSFVITGRGGIPLSPDEPLEGPAVVPQWIPLPEEVRAIESRGARKTRDAGEAVQNPLVEAHGLVIKADGTIELVAAGVMGNLSSIGGYPPCRTAPGN